MNLLDGGEEISGKGEQGFVNELFRVGLDRLILWCLLVNSVLMMIGFDSPEHRK
jgi:hypothetical protein